MICERFRHLSNKKIETRTCQVDKTAAFRQLVKVKKETCYCYVIPLQIIVFFIICVLQSFRLTFLFYFKTLVFKSLHCRQIWSCASFSLCVIFELNEQEEESRIDPFVSCKKYNLCCNIYLFFTPDLLYRIQLISN